jgi:hypothetical protein
MLHISFFQHPFVFVWCGCDVCVGVGLCCVVLFVAVLSCGCRVVVVWLSCLVLPFARIIVMREREPRQDKKQESCLAPRFLFCLDPLFFRSPEKWTALFETEGRNIWLPFFLVLCCRCIVLCSFVGLISSCFMVASNCG